jgi:hypothetical protein
LSRPSERAKMRPPPTVTSTLAAAGFGSSDPEADGSRSLFSRCNRAAKDNKCGSVTN